MPRPPPDNRSLLRRLLADGSLDLEADPAEVLPAPARGTVAWDRVEGMLLGLAIGDSLGNTSESLTPRERLAAHGEVRDYLPNPRAGGRSVGLPSDDTQLAFWTLAQLLEDGGLVPERLAEQFRSGRIHGIGSSVRAFLAAMAEGRPWYRAGPRSAGNGALMRIAPVLVPHLRGGGSGLWVDAALGGAITHNDRLSTGSCVAFVRVLWDCLRLERHPPQGWWTEAFARTLQALEGDEPRYTPRIPGQEGRRVAGWRFTREALVAAFERELPARQACDLWHSGAFLLETVPSVLYILELHGDDPEEAIVRAVNDTKDNDTAAAIVGAAVGALHGAEALPQRWIDGLLGRTREGDDGEVFRLLDAAALAYASSA